MTLYKLGRRHMVGRCFASMVKCCVARSEVVPLHRSITHVGFYIGPVMEPVIAEIKSSEYVTHDVKWLVLTRPEDFEFLPSRGWVVALDLGGRRDQWWSLTYSSLPEARTFGSVVKICASC